MNSRTKVNSIADRFLSEALTRVMLMPIAQLLAIAQLLNDRPQVLPKVANRYDRAAIPASQDRKTSGRNEVSFEQESCDKNRPSGSFVLSAATDLLIASRSVHEDFDGCITIP